MTALFRYAGSKEKTCPALFEIMLRSCPQPERYLTPTLGSGADLYYALSNGIGREYLAADKNEDLTVAHQVTRDIPELLISRLLSYAYIPESEQREWYTGWRKGVPSESLSRAARALFLIGCGYNGLWRESKKSGYNVPFGKCFSLDAERLRNCSRLLNSKPGQILACDFADLLAQARAGDLVYIDPPFYLTAAHYQYKWSEAEHARLYTAAKLARSNGACVFISNSDKDETRALYAGATAYHSLIVNRTVAPRAVQRKKMTELLIEV